MLLEAEASGTQALTAYDVVHLEIILITCLRLAWVIDRSGASDWALQIILS